jgi:hypothetical protein
MISSGKLLLEAVSKEATATLQEKITNSVAAFGPEATARPMSTITSYQARHAAIHNVPAHYTDEQLLAEAKIEYPNITSITSLIKPNIYPTKRPIKLTTKDHNEHDRLLKNGLKVGWEILRAEPWRNTPSASTASALAI